YYPCLDATVGRPYGLYVHGNDDTTGALAGIERIVTGLRWKLAQPPLSLTGSPDRAALDAAWELGAAVSAGVPAGAAAGCPAGSPAAPGSRPAAGGRTPPGGRGDPSAPRSPAPSGRPRGRGRPPTGGRRRAAPPGRPERGATRGPGAGPAPR